MKKLLAAVLAASMCLSYATLASAAQSSRETTGDVDSGVVTFLKPDHGSLTAIVDSGAVAARGVVEEGPLKSGESVEVGKTVKFTVKPDAGYEVEKWTGTTTVAGDKFTATLKVAKGSNPVSVTLKSKVDANEFTVKVEQSNGGLLNIYDRDAKKYLPVGEDVKIPKGNWLELGYTNASGTVFDAASVNEKPFENQVQVTENMTIKGSFKASSGGDTGTDNEWYGIYANPDEFISADPLIVSGKLELLHWDGNYDHDDQVLSGTTFKFSDVTTIQSDNDKFTLTEAGAFASKDKLDQGSYRLLVDAKHGGNEYLDQTVTIIVEKNKMVRVSFSRYVSENISTSGMLRPSSAQVVSGTTFGNIDKPNTDAIGMYNHSTTPGWFNLSQSDAKISDDFAVTKNLSVRVKYDGYTINMLGLDGNPETPNKPTPTPPPSGGGSSGGGGGGGGGSIISGGGISGSNSGSATVSSGTASKEATKAVENAVKAAAKSGSKSANAAITFKNVKSMAPDVFKAINAAAAKASKGIAVKTAVQMDTVVNGKVEARMYIDPTLAAGLKTAIKTTVDISPKGKENAKTAAVMSKYYSNTAAVVSFAQQGAFGMNIQTAVKIDTSRMNTKTLMFYSYNAKTNQFTAITAPSYFVDSAGFLHFTTPVGGSIVITDKPLTRK